MVSMLKIHLILLSCSALVLGLSLTFSTPSLVIPETLAERGSNLTISIDGSCGGTSGNTCQGSSFGNCCSRLGYCGLNGSYCASGCQSDFGTCLNSNLSSDGSCGGSGKISCQGSDFGNCCSVRGYCGSNSSYCGAGCQSQFGTCFPSGSTALPSSSSTSSSSSSRSTLSTSLTSTSASTSTTSSLMTSTSATVSLIGTSSVSPSPTLLPTTQSKPLSPGTIAGIALAAIAGVALLAALLWFFWHQRAKSTQSDIMPSWKGDADKYQKPAEEPWVTHEMSTERVPELGSQEPIVELHGSSVHKERKEAQMAVDERVAAGYEGAYRGN